MKIQCLIFAAAMLAATAADAHPVRSRAAKAQFIRANACPATGLKKLPCKDWVIDHKLALCAGGRDIAKNLQWSPLAESRKKDQEEFALCRMVRKGLIKKTTSSAKICPIAQRENWPLTVAALCKK